MDKSAKHKKTKNSRPSKYIKKSISTGTSTSSLSQYSEEELLKKTQDEIDKFQFKEAKIYCQEALKMNPESLKALSICASVCIDTEDIDNAKHYLQFAITLAPEEGYSKYFSLGQLSEGEEALKYYKKGIDILEKLLDSKASKKAKNKSENAANSDDENEDISDSDNLKRKLSSAYCAVAELYMADLCDDKEAEENSEKYIKLAIKSDASNHEGFQQYASFYLVKNNKKKAKSMILNSVSLWLRNHEEAGVDDPIDDPELEPNYKGCNRESSFLTPSVRIAAAKILIEVKKYEVAEDVLEDLLLEEDEDVYTWYLLGWTHYLQGEEHMEEAKMHFKRALELNESNPCSDDAVLGHMEDLLYEIGMEVYSPAGSAMDDDDMGDLWNFSDMDDDDGDDDNDDDSDDDDSDEWEDINDDDIDGEEEDDDTDEDGSHKSDDDNAVKEVKDKQVPVV